MKHEIQEIYIGRVSNDRATNICIKPKTYLVKLFDKVVFQHILKLFFGNLFILLKKWYMSACLAFLQEGPEGAFWAKKTFSVVVGVWATPKINCLEFIPLKLIV